MIRAIVIMTLFMSMLGCTTEDPHPELKDPIYKDLEARLTNHTKAIEEAKKKLGELRVAAGKAEANSIDRKDVLRDIAKQQVIVREAEKGARYYKIRADRRAVVDKIAAREALQAGKPWPDPNEYSQYKVNNRLREASLNWGARVPRLQDRLRAPAATKGKTEGEGEAAAPAGH
jgi:nitrate/nitrite-specific signal transduction histidine kinase